jgi:hypothetical protein
LYGPFRIAVAEIPAFWSWDRNEDIHDPLSSVGAVINATNLAVAEIKRCKFL